MATSQYRANELIRALEVRLIDEQGNQVGTVSIGDAIRRAQDAGLDLVEVSPDARPPVCKILDYRKFMDAIRRAEGESNGE